MQRNLGKLLGKKLLPPNFRLLFLLSQFIFLATVRRKMNWKRCIFPASQIVAHSLLLPLCGKYSVVLNSKCLHFKYIVSKQQVSVRIIFSFDFSREIRPWNWPWQLVNTEHASLKKKILCLCSLQQSTYGLFICIGTITVFKNHKKGSSYVCLRGLQRLFASLAKRSEIEKLRDSDMRHFW